MKENINILVLDENPDIVENVQIILEKRGYKVEGFLDPVKALDFLVKGKIKPDLILSDIKMPNLNGYEFYKRVNKHPQTSNIPFIFISGKSKPDEIRIGKRLGVDDYITKPFTEEDLLSVISGKVRRYRRNLAVQKGLIKRLEVMKFMTSPSISLDQKDKLFFLYMKWDEKEGAKLAKYYPNKKIDHPSLTEVGNQLFQAFNSIYKPKELSKNFSETILVTLKNINKKAYLNYFKKEGTKTSEIIMLGIIAPEISYLHSLRLEQIFEEIKNSIIHSTEWNIKEYWKKALKILGTNPL
ncbi:MAG: putative Signal transduction response regulator [Promethearchaeota archaeon]|nr:MAG: putative Signal transduction response regulator [Candidatus Lokiarchaeota archaeon]